MNYSSEFKEDSQTYARTGCGALDYYYEAIQVNVAQSSYYNIYSAIGSHPYGYIYKDNFSPFNPSINIYLENYDGCASAYRFKFFTHLESNTTYILVVTTFFPRVRGAFLIIVFGPKNVTLKRLSEYIFAIFSIITRERRNLVNV